MGPPRLRVQVGADEARVQAVRLDRRVLSTHQVVHVPREHDLGNLRLRIRARLAVEVPTRHISIVR